jgi:hypothetical protein
MAKAITGSASIWAARPTKTALGFKNILVKPLAD